MTSILLPRRETWLHKGMCTGLLDPNAQYIVLRNDRVLSRGGGVCVFIQNALRVVPVNIGDEFCDIEVISLDVIASNTRARFFVVYRPPKQDVEAVKYTRNLVKCLLKNESKKYTNIEYLYSPNKYGRRINSKNTIKTTQLQIRQKTLKARFKFRHTFGP